MGFGFGRLGHKIANSVGAIGQKIHDGANRIGTKVKQGANYVVEHSEKIKSVADKVGDIAGKVGKVSSVIAKGAETALPFTAEIPIVGEVVGGVAGLAEGVSGASSLIGKGAKGVSVAMTGIGIAKKRGLIGNKR
tara:strand:+ start:3319 stop:3723 length:405 start_codon:yes stop_codon:yes gene_type:complete